MNTIITVFTGNLFEIAAHYLGDATQWIRIAELNGLSDPVIHGLTHLELPPIDRASGGGIVIQQ